MKTRIAILFLFVVTSPFNATEVLSLPDVYVCPEILRVDGTDVIFNYNLTFYVYELHPFGLKAKFGREGEGPGEFKNLIHLSVRSQQLLVYSLGKISFFSRQGCLINELKLPGGRHLEPAGEGYIGYAMEPSERLINISVNLYNSNGKKLKSVLKRTHFFQLNRPMDLIRLASGRPQRAHYQVYGNRLFIEGEQDTIHVFDVKGRLEFIIKLKYPRMLVGTSHRREILDILHRRFKSDRVRQLIKNNGFFPEYFPVRRFVIDEERIYIPTFRRQQDQTQLIILNLKGKIIKKKFLPFSDLNLLVPYTYTIYQGKLYQFVENEESEHLEIHIHDIPE